MAYDRLKCQLCAKDFGQEVGFLRHVADVHGLQPDEELYVTWTLVPAVKPTCACGCGQVVKWNGWKKGYTSKYLRGHNAASDTVFADPVRAKEFAEKRAKGYADGKYSSWNKGLTKENDPRIQVIADKISASLIEGYASGSIVDWHALDPDKARAAVAKQSATKAARFASGELVPWNKGETKETNPIIAAAAVKIAAQYTRPNAGARIKLDQVKERIDAHADKFTAVSDLSEYTTRRVARLKFRCTVCGTEQSKSLAMLEECPVCFTCHPKESKGQLEVYDFVKALSPDAVLSDRTVIAPLELDVFVPSHKLGIEYNGLYFHSAECLTDPNYHQRKLEACLTAGINLFSVYEDEWRDRRPIIEAMIRHRLLSPTVTYHARKLSVVELPTAQARAFFDANNLEGYARSSVTLGLVDTKDGVVAAMALRRPFHRGHASSYEVSRCCAKLGTSVRGWLGKLTTRAAGWAAERGSVQLMTYVDARVGRGTGYEAAGWQLVKASTGIRFWWTDFDHRYNRFKFKADKARGMTQAQVADEAGVVQIFGCTNSSWRYVI